MHPDYQRRGIGRDHAKLARPFEWIPCGNADRRARSTAVLREAGLAQDNDGHNIPA